MLITIMITLSAVFLGYIALAMLYIMKQHDQIDKKIDSIEKKCEQYLKDIKKETT